LSDDLPVEDLTDLYENAPCGYVSLAPDRRIAKLNQTLANWLGRPVEELVGQPFNTALSFGGKIAFETHMAPMLRLQERIDEIALDLIDASGKRMPVLVNAVEKRSADGDHVLTRLTLFKAVERRKYERSLIEARQDAEVAARVEHETAVLREQFIAVLGHDLRNPVASLGAGVRLLGTQSLSDRGRTVVKLMGQSVARASLLIDNVLDFARGRLGEGLSLVRNSNEPLTPVLEHVVGEVRLVVPDRIINASFAIEEPIDCDRQRLGQLAANLISNAVAHGAPGVPIDVEVRTDGATLTLSVTNGGDPIPPEAREKLFEPFFRGGIRPSQQGLGLGLFIVSEIAKAHGGAIAVSSNERRTSFVFTMPIERS
jgi:sigma-B regulation protein RsbU (phosphoserine phosphatase)